MPNEPEVVTIDRDFTAEQVSIFLQESLDVDEAMADYLSNNVVDMIIDQTTYEESVF